MKQYRLPLILLGITLIFVVLSESNRPKEVDWSPGYRAGETKPLGCYILHDQLEKLFPGQEITEVDQTLYEGLFDSERTIASGGNYILITDQLNLSYLDTRSFLEFIREGGTALIAASEIEGPLADSLYVETDRNFSMQEWGEDGEEGSVARASLEFMAPSIGEDRTYQVRLPRSDWGGMRYFSLFDEDLSWIVEQTAGEVSLQQGGAEQSRARLITTLRIELDAGNIILTSLPQGLSNVALLEEEGLDRAAVLLSYLPTAPIFWDEYYKPQRMGRSGGMSQGSPMSYIQSRPALYTAWILLLGGLILFILFGARRRQRVIPVVEDPKNVTLEFIETVGNLYHDRGSYTDLALRRTTSLLEYIRENLGLPTSTVDELFLRRLAERSGVDPLRVAELGSWIIRAERGGEFKASELLDYNREIEHFYANTER